MPFDYSPAWISIKTSILATAVTFLLGVAAARFMRGERGKFKEFVNSVLLLPMVLPPTVVGLALLIVFGIQSPIGRLLDNLGYTIVFSWSATVIAACVVSFPIMYMTALGGFDQVDPDIEDAARTLGASEWTVFKKITMPAAKSSLLAGMVLTFARSLGEFGATLMLAGNIPGKTETLPLAVYFSNEGGNSYYALIYAGIIMAISLGTLYLLKMFSGKSGNSRRIVPESSDIY